MGANVARLQGVEWQEWANQLLMHHYGPTEYQRIPDRQKGDAGLEGFTISDGHAYQAYGCEEPLSTQQRYEKQRDKMTLDINKFIKNRKILGSLLGKTKVSRWVLFVPFHDSKDLIAHASSKTNEIVKASLSYVATKFRVVVCDEDYFGVSREALLSASVKALHVSVDSVDADSVADWAETNDKLVATVDEKIAKLPALTTEAKRKAFRDKVLGWYLEGQTILDELRRYPSTYEKVVQAKSHRENFLVSSSLAAGSPAEEFCQAITQLRETFKQHVKEVSDLSAEALAHEAVADWLIRCPLDFAASVQNV